MKKTIFLCLLVTLFSIPAFGAKPSEDLYRVTRALINNPDLVLKLNENYSADLVDYEVKEVSSTFYEYSLKFQRNCECHFSTAKIRISEDLSETAADGPIIYQSSIEIVGGR